MEAPESGLKDNIYEQKQAFRTRQNVWNTWRCSLSSGLWPSALASHQICWPAFSTTEIAALAGSPGRNPRYRRWGISPRP